MPVKGSIVGEYNKNGKTIRVGTIREKTIVRVDLYSLLCKMGQ